MDKKAPPSVLEINSSFIGIGSNVGNRLSHCQRAVQALQKHEAIRVNRISSLYETAPIGFLEQRRFYNAVLAIETKLGPEQLLSYCQDIECALGKNVEVPDGPRTIDLDLLFYADTVSTSEELMLPHPQLTKRHFVLLPLAEVAPDFLHPISLCSMTKLLAALGPFPNDALEKRFSPGWEKIVKA